MHQPFCVRTYLYECAEIENTSDRTFETFTSHIFTREIDNFLKCRICCPLPACYEDGPVLFYCDVIAVRAFSNTVYHFSSRADNKPNLVYLNLRSENFRCTR